MKKFELTTEYKINIFGKKLYRIKALVDFGTVKAGDLGGFIEKEDNVSMYGNAWVYDDAEVYDDAKVCDNASVYNNARVYDNARICDDAEVYGGAEVHGYARVYDDACVYDEARVLCNAEVCDCARIFGNASVSGDARVCDNARICESAEVYGSARVSGDSWVSGDTEVCDCARIHDDTDYITIKGIGENFGCMTFFRCKDGLVRVNCDFFFGTIQEFRKVVTKTIDSQFAKEYLMIANLMEYHFKMDLMDLKFKMFY